MFDGYAPVADLIHRVRSRWRSRVALQSLARALSVAAVVAMVALLIARVAMSSPAVLAIACAVGLLGVMASLGWGLWPMRRPLSDAQVARFIEERHPGLDDRLATAVSLLASSENGRPAFAASMIRDAARAAREIEPAEVVATDSLRRAGLQAAAAAAVFAVVLVMGAGTAMTSLDALSLKVFPSRLAIEVMPGNARARAGSNLTVKARLVGSSVPVRVRLLRTPSADADQWETIEMAGDGHQQFTAELSRLASSFRYRVEADAARSDTFEVTVVRPPRVRRIDVEYLYPEALAMKPRLEQDGGDIYAPAGTDVRLHVVTDAPVKSGRIVLDAGVPIELRSDTQPDATGSETTLSGSLTVGKDGSYRVALVGPDDVTSESETEYFIRTIEDRPPDVHVTRPASDRRVTALEELAVEADATDDFGVASLDLVYAVRGGAETTVPLTIPVGSTSVTGRRTIYLEDLHVRPGDFVSYYVRARDLGRGRASREGRSDIFFLEVKPFDEEFTLAQSQASMGGGASDTEMDDLVTAQKDIIVATWKLDRRTQAARGARPEADIRAVGRAQSALRTRVEQASTSLRTGVMRTPRRRTRTPQGDNPAGLGAGETLSEEDAMGLASQAMGRAIANLDALDTRGAITPEMEALNQLLLAQADVRKRQIQQQQSAGAGGGNRRTQDLSSLFDKELARNQQTNYETSKNSGQSENRQARAIDEIRDLARRQDELLREQQDLARRQAAMSGEALKRELERLRREQNELQQSAESLAQKLSREQQGQTGAQGASGQSGQSSRGDGRTMRDVSEEMRGAASGLGDRDPEEASRRAERALEGLRQLERHLEAGTPDGRRRALGDTQLEARQLADAERQIAEEARRSGGDQDTMRRLAGEQDRLAERTRRLGGDLKRQSASPATGSGRDRDAAQSLQSAAAEAGREIEQQRLAERMNQAAESMRTAEGMSKVGGSQEEMARALDRMADRLANAGQAVDGESQKLSSRVARARELRERLEQLANELERLDREAGKGGASGTSAESRAEGERVRDQALREMQEAGRLLDEARRGDPSSARGGAGFTFEGQGMTLSDPGTQGFKQDFAKWQELKRQATSALQHAESSMAKRLQERQAKDRLASGADDRAPASYQEQVDRYFKALAAGKKP